MAQISFRTAVLSDAIEIADFMTRNFLFAYGHSASPENIDKAVKQYYGAEAQKEDLVNSNIINCLCTYDNSIIGLAQVKPPLSDKSPDEYELSRFYVDSAYHGKGIAAPLMQETINILSEKSAASLWLSVWQESQQAIRFYQKQGFEISGETIFMIGDAPMNDWLMTKKISL